MLVCTVLVGCGGEGNTSSNEPETLTLVEDVRVSFCDQRLREKLTHEDISSVTYFGYDTDNFCYVLRFNFNEEGKTKLQTFTTNNKGTQVYLFINEEPAASPLIMAEITDGRCAITFENEHLAKRYFNMLTQKSDPQ